MSTRSEVYIQHKDGSLHGCYIHYDGYPSHRGIECIAHSEAGSLDDFIKENCKEDNYEGYDYNWACDDELLQHLTDSDRSWTYIKCCDGTWNVFKHTFDGKKFGYENAGDIWKLVAKDSCIYVKELRQRVSVLSKHFRREYGKDESKPYRVHIIRLSVTVDYLPKVEQYDYPQESFDNALKYFNKIFIHIKKENVEIINKTKTQFIAKNRQYTLVVTLI